MTLPSYPQSPGNNVQPGWYPLRPLTIGELLAAGLRVAVRHLAVLAPLAFAISALSSAVNLLVLAAKGSLRDYADGDLTRLPAGATAAQLDKFVRNFYGQVLPALAASAVIGLVLSPVLAGVATPFAAQAATTRAGTHSGALLRLRGRWPVLLGIGLAVGLLMGAGFVALVVPGILVWLLLLPAGPVAAMEGLGIAETMHRAAALSKGFRLRLLGVSLLMGLIVGAIGLVVSSILQQLVGADDPVTRLILGQLIGAVVSGIVAPWSSAVTAMLYIDIRMRREGLGQALLAASRPSYWS